MPPQTRKAKADAAEAAPPAQSALGKGPRAGTDNGSKAALSPTDADVASATAEADGEMNERPVKKQKKKKGSSQAAAGAGMASGGSKTGKSAISSSNEPSASASTTKKNKMSRELEGLKDGRDESDVSVYGSHTSGTGGKRRSRRINKDDPPATNVQRPPLPAIGEEDEEEEQSQANESEGGGQEAPLMQPSHDPGAVMEGDINDEHQELPMRRARSPRSTTAQNKRDANGSNASREDLRAFQRPAFIDFSTVDAEEIARNFAPHGGGVLQPESSEKEVREQYEREKPVVRYTVSNPVPPDPRSPRGTADDDDDLEIKLLRPTELKYGVRARWNNAKARSHDDNWEAIWTTLAAYNPSDDVYDLYDYCWRRSRLLKDTAYFADIPDWPAGIAPQIFFLQVRDAVEVARMESLVPQWKDQIVLTGQQFGAAAAQDLQQKLAALTNGVRDRTKIANLPTDDDLFEAEWAGRLEQISRGKLGKFRDTTGRTQHRLKAAHRRALKIRTDYGIRVRPPRLNDGVIHTSMEHYCNRLHATLRQTLIDYIRPAWPPMPSDPVTTNRWNRMVYRVFQGQDPYAFGQASPKELDYEDIGTREIGFDHVRSQQTPGRWEYREHLGSGSFGQVGVWKCYNKFGKIIDRLAIKDTYLANPAKFVGFNAWKQPSYWYGNIHNRIPKEYAAMVMLNACENSENIVRCRAYSVYEERAMYRLYTEYCGHKDLEYTIERYRNLAMLNADMAVIDGIAPEKARIPDRVLWCVLEALASAACLMDLGYIPTDNPETDIPPPSFQNLLHRDLKPLNIFLGTPRRDAYWPKIPTPKVGDFGGVIFCNEENSSTEFWGTHGYTSREVLRKGVPHPITPKSDIWSIGRVMLSLINLNHQEDQEMYSRMSQVDHETTPEFRAGADEGRHALLLELVRSCLAPLPADRPTAKELWRRIWREVAFEEPMTRIRFEEDEMLIFESDRYEAFAG